MSEEVLYQKRIPIHIRSVKGAFRTFKTSVLLIAFSVYFLLPWLPWDRGPNAPNQAVIYDIPGRHFYILGLTVQVQDIFWLAGFLMIAAWLLFMMTSLFGRVFCGYFCFQTLWTDTFMFVEHFVQGDRNARLKLDKAPWNREKALKMGLTYAIWLAIAFWTGLTFTLYWGESSKMVWEMLTGTAPVAAYATTGLLTITTFIMAGLAREQVCTYMCPYARFQSAMFDRDTMIVSYDERRGEGTQSRARVAKGVQHREERQISGHGDCVDCGYCVQVCPAGIDIRNGLQYQCISCGLCIDACNTVMDKLQWPRGLIRYTSLNQLEGGVTHLIKPKTIGYAIVLLAASSVLTWSILNQAPYSLVVEQIRQPLSVMMSDGSIQNTYELKFNNKLTQDAHFAIAIDRLANGSLDLGDLEVLSIESQKNMRLFAKVRVQPSPNQPNRVEFDFVATPVNGSIGSPLRNTVAFYLP